MFSYKNVRLDFFYFSGPIYTDNEWSKSNMFQLFRFPLRKITWKYYIFLLSFVIPLGYSNTKHLNCSDPFFVSMTRLLISKTIKGALRDRVIFSLKILHNILSRGKWVKLDSDFFLFMKTLSKNLPDPKKGYRPLYLRNKK